MLYLRMTSMTPSINSSSLLVRKKTSGKTINIMNSNNDTHHYLQLT